MGGCVGVVSIVQGQIVRQIGSTANGMHSKPLLALFGVLNRKNEMRAAR